MKIDTRRPVSPFDSSVSPAPATPPGLLKRTADAVRAWYDRASRRTSPSFVVVLAVVLAAVAYALVQAALSTDCADLPVSLARLEVTYTATRFAAMFGAEGACRHAVVASFLPDTFFAIAYGLALSSLFLWAERWRRYEAGYDWRPIAQQRKVHRRRVFIVLPLVAAALDMTFENVPLWWAARTISFTPAGAPIVAPGVGVAVLVASIAATLKWMFLLVAAGGLITEVFAGPRGFVLRRLRFSVLAVALGALPLLLVGQGQDILQRVAEGSYRYPHTLLSVLAIALASTLVWNCGRRLLQLRFARDGDECRASSWYAFFATHIPRLLGVAMFALCGAAFAHAGLALPTFAVVSVGGLLVVTLLEHFAPRVLMFTRRFLPAAHDDANPFGSMNYAARRLSSALIASAIGLVVLVHPSGPPDETASELYVLRVAAWICLVATWFFYLFVYYRRSVREARGRTHLFAAFDVEDATALEGRLRRHVAIVLAISAVLLVLFAVAPVTVGRALGPVWVLSLAVGNAVIIGSIAVWAHARYRVPVVRIAIAMALLFSFWNDNHRVRTVADQRFGNGALGPRVTLAQQLDQWLAARGAGASNDVVPMVFVAASGGGLRAAYWTARTLATAADRDTSFVHHLFAISGVSGGSLGGAMFAAVARDAAGHPERLPCAAPAAANARYTRCVMRFMSDDYLSPVLAKMLAPDALQRFLPFPVTALDRSQGLEQSFERSYDADVGRPTMQQGLLALAGDSAARVMMPTLLLNATHVETGRRYVASAANVAGALHDSPDVLQLLHSDLPLSAAVHNSARFTLVSPAGHLVDPTSEGVELGHVVDGGYFENSGLATLQEVVSLLDASPWRATVHPIVLYLCNDPVTCDSEERTAIPDSLTRTHSTWANELLAPVRAILNTRDARGALALAQMRGRFGADFLELDVCGSLEVELTQPQATSADSSRLEEGHDRVVSPPLGWLLSLLARDWMDSSLVMDSTRAAGPNVAPGSCRVRNTRQLQRLSALLRR